MRPERERIVSELPARLSKMKILRASPNRIVLGTEADRAVVRLEFDGNRKTWLLTAYDMP
jgi:hypothetical protein